MLSRGTLLQYTQPPKGSFNGTPSSNTSVRLTPLGPIPRRETPCAVGWVTRLLLRRNKLNPGICRNRSSTVRAGDCWISSLVMTVTFAGTSRNRCSIRLAEITTGSRRTGSCVSPVADDGGGAPHEEAVNHVSVPTITNPLMPQMRRAGTHRPRLTVTYPSLQKTSYLRRPPRSFPLDAGAGHRARRDRGRAGADIAKYSNRGGRGLQ